MKQPDPTIDTVKYVYTREGDRIVFDDEEHLRWYVGLEVVKVLDEIEVANHPFVFVKTEEGVQNMGPSAVGTSQQITDTINDLRKQYGDGEQVLVTVTSVEKAKVPKLDGSEVEEAK